jgi:hypothetical protein
MPVGLSSCEEFQKPGVRPTDFTALWEQFLLVGDGSFTEIVHGNAAVAKPWRSIMPLTAGGGMMPGE